MKAVLKLLKRTMLGAFGAELRIKPSLRCNARFYGSDYGGFYLNPDLIGSDSVVYSFGIGEDISFDREVIRLHDCQVHGFDPTPRSIKWVKSQELPRNFTMHEFGIARETGLATFYLPKNENFVSGSLIGHGSVRADVPIQVPVKSFADIIGSLEHKVIDVLKMDIEGAEYDVLESILESQA
ncbi:MAG: FkbM family methyltransferase, partial [Imperialibacter sp.]